MAFSFGASSSQPSSGFGSAGNTGSTFGATTNSSAGTLFGAGANTNASSAGTLFGAGTSNNTTGTTFGNSASNTAAGTLFGANTGNSFGATSQSGSSFGFGNTSTATSTAPTTAFGAQQTTTPAFGFGQQQQQQNPGFGATSAPGTTGFGFGANNNTAAGGGFGGFGNNATATSTAGSFGGFGINNTATSNAATGGFFKPAASTLGTGGFQSTLPFGASNQQQSNTQFGGFGTGGNTGFGGFGQQQQQHPQQPPSRNVWQELALIRAHWDPSSRLSQFRHYFYNVVQPNERHLYIRPPDQDEELWNEAMRKNPDPNNLVPVLAVGYGDVLKRMDIQDQAVEVHRNKLAEIGERLQTIQQKHALVTLVKIEEQRRRNIDLTQRLIRMLRCVQVLRYRGFPLEHDEEKLLQNLKLIAEQPSNPEQLNNKLRDAWIALQQIKRKRQEAPEDSWRATSKEDLATIAQLLAQEQDGLRHINSTLSKDMEEIQNIEENLRSHIKRASRGRNAMMTGS
ncbi:nucleoporin complex subunit 54-domain-containing protein [Fennellomyces sp. T-0311]|nr:nucleoporin complex subunit 54-domain-containing protein [Fennellomyces sp. T-0311]